MSLRQSLRKLRPHIVTAPRAEDEPSDADGTTEDVALAEEKNQSNQQRNTGQRQEEEE